MLPPPMKAMVSRSCVASGHVRVCARLGRRAARRTARCRRGPCVAPSAMASSKSSLMPIDSVSTPADGRGAGASNKPRMRREGIAPARSMSGCGVGIAIRPRRRSRGCGGDRGGQRRRPRPARQPDLLASSSMLTWTSTFSGARSAGRGGPSAATSFGAVHASAPSRTASPPPRPCSTAGGRSGATPAPAPASSAMLGRGLLHVVLAEGALAGGGQCRDRRRVGWVLDTASRRGTGRPAARAALSSRCRTSCRACVSTSTHPGMAAQSG